MSLWKPERAYRPGDTGLVIAFVGLFICVIALLVTLPKKSPAATRVATAHDQGYYQLDVVVKECRAIFPSPDTIEYYVSFYPVDSQGPTYTVWGTDETLAGRLYESLIEGQRIWLDWRTDPAGATEILGVSTTSKVIH